MSIKRVGIAIDKWKLDIFTKVLNEADYAFTRKPELTPKMLILYVEIPEAEVAKLVDIVAVANNRAAKSKSKGWN